MGLALQGGTTYLLTPTERKNAHQFLAIVAGESSNNTQEAKLIGEVMINRMLHKGLSFNAPNLFELIGERGIAAMKQTGPRHGYPALMRMQLEAVLGGKHDFAARTNAAISAMLDPQESDPDNLHTPYFWDVSANYKATRGPWNYYRNGDFSIVQAIGETTFFRYRDNRRRWP